MLDAATLVSAALAGACAMLLEGREDRCPSECVLAFHKAVAAGRLEEIGNFFSFGSAYRYWQDVTAALGIRCGDEESFKGLVTRILEGNATRANLSSYVPGRFRVKVIGAVASVVFAKNLPQNPLPRLFGRARSRQARSDDDAMQRRALWRRSDKACRLHSGSKPGWGSEIDSKGELPGGGDAVASAVLEDGRWKVRTYPGAFPGELLSHAAREGGAKEDV